MFCGRCLVDLRITFWRRIFLHKYNYFSSFGAGICVSNSSFKWMKNSPEQFGSMRVSKVMTLLSRHKVGNLTHFVQRPNTLPDGQRASPQYWILWGGRGEGHFCFFETWIPKQKNEHQTSAWQAVELITKPGSALLHIKSKKPNLLSENN